MSGCPLGRCDGSGFLYDEAARRAYPCACRPQRIARRKAAAVAGRIPKRFKDVAFERQPVVSMPADVVRAVRAYCDRIGENLAEGRGLYFRGDTGTGKTTLAMLISKQAMLEGHTVAIYSLPRLLGMLRDTYDDDSELSLNELLNRLTAVDLLHVDDLGAQQTSAWVLEQLYSIVNSRYEDRRAIVFTTNLEDAELRAQIGERTVSRLCGMCEEVPLYGDDHRRDELLIRYPKPYGAAA